MCSSGNIIGINNPFLSCILLFICLFYSSLKLYTHNFMAFDKKKVWTQNVNFAFKPIWSSKPVPNRSTRHYFVNTIFIVSQLISNLAETFGNMSWYLFNENVKMSERRLHCHIVTLSHCHIVTLSHCHIVPLSHCHIVTVIY